MFFSQLMQTMSVYVCVLLLDRTYCSPFPRTARTALVSHKPDNYTLPLDRTYIYI